MGDLSAHFDTSEFRDRRTGKLKAPPLELVWRLEDLRTRVGRALPIVSGYRSPTTNLLVRGRVLSRHLRGDAVDIPPQLVTVDQALASGFRGIGYCGDWVVHLDTRPRAVKPFRDCPRGRTH